jgi:hypothetical protein
MLAIVAHEINAANPGVLGGEAGDDVPASVVRTVVDEDQFAGGCDGGAIGELLEDGEKARDEQFEAVLAVVDRDNDRDAGRQRRGCRGWDHLVRSMGEDGAILPGGPAADEDLCAAVRHCDGHWGKRGKRPAAPLHKEAFPGSRMGSHHDAKLKAKQRPFWGAGVRGRLTNAAKNCYNTAFKPQGTPEWQSGAKRRIVPSLTKRSPGNRAETFHL